MALSLGTLSHVKFDKYKKWLVCSAYCNLSIQGRIQEVRGGGGGGPGGQYSPPPFWGTP